MGSRALEFHIGPIFKFNSVLYCSRPHGAVHEELVGLLRKIRVDRLLFKIISGRVSKFFRFS